MPEHYEIALVGNCKLQQSIKSVAAQDRVSDSTRKHYALCSGTKPGLQFSFFKTGIARLGDMREVDSSRV